MSFTVFLGNLPTWVTADDIKQWLAAEDLVADSVKVIRNHETQESKGFAFVEAPTGEELQSLIRRFDRAPPEYRLLRPNPAQPPKGKDAPPRGAQPPVAGAPINRVPPRPDRKRRTGKDREQSPRSALDRKSTRLNSSHSLHDALPISSARCSTTRRRRTHQPRSSQTRPQTPHRQGSRTVSPQRLRSEEHTSELQSLPTRRSSDLLRAVLNHPSPAHPSTAFLPDQTANAAPARIANSLPAAPLRLSWPKFSSPGPTLPRVRPRHSIGLHTCELPAHRPLNHPLWLQWFAIGGRRALHGRMKYAWLGCLLLCRLLVAAPQ